MVSTLVPLLPLGHMYSVAQCKRPVLVERHLFRANSEAGMQVMHSPSPEQHHKWKSAENVTEWNKKLSSNEDIFNHQMLSTFPAEDLHGKVVMVRCRFHVTCSSYGLWFDNSSTPLSTIEYLLQLGAKVVIASHWTCKNSLPKVITARDVADHISRHLQQRVEVANGVIGEEVQNLIKNLKNKQVILLQNLSLQRREISNDIGFARSLVEGIDYLVNDDFSTSHRMLASTVGAARFACGRFAGLQLEHDISIVKRMLHESPRPFTAIVGGGDLSKKIDIIRALIKKCDTIILVGTVALALLASTGMQVPNLVVSQDLMKEAQDLLCTAKVYNTELVLPVDLSCRKQDTENQNKTFNTQEIPDGWEAVDIGPQSLGVMLGIMKKSKAAFWTGSCGMFKGNAISPGTIVVAKFLSSIGKSGCFTVVSGNEACAALEMLNFCKDINRTFKSTSALFEYLKGNILHGIVALDPASPCQPDWNSIFNDSHLPLIIDIGSGNGLFILDMAKKRKHQNFLGLEMNAKLVERCTHSTLYHGLTNVHFMVANATTALRHVVAGYPGLIAVIAIQCPNPDFNRPNDRWRMVQRPLVEAIVDLLPAGGKIFLQSDIETVATHMRDEFQRYCGGKVKPSKEHNNPCSADASEWLDANPFGVTTDWENHVLERGDKMYRLLLERSDTHQGL